MAGCSNLVEKLLFHLRELWVNLQSHNHFNDLLSSVIVVLNQPGIERHPWTILSSKEGVYQRVLRAVLSPLTAGQREIEF